MAPRSTGWPVTPVGTTWGWAGQLAHLRGHPVGERGPAGQPHLAAEHDEAGVEHHADRGRPGRHARGQLVEQARPRSSPAWAAATAACTAAAAVGAGNP